MKKNSFIYVIAIALITIVACSKESNDLAPNAKRLNPLSVRSLARCTDTAHYQFIPMDSANRMINSYLYSINYTMNDTDLRSLSINADSIRLYLNSNPGISSVKLMFAHTLNYINSGGEGQYAGYQSGALTIIMAGYDRSGNYIYMPTGMVIDHATPCPASCPTVGDAAFDLLR